MPRDPVKRHQSNVAYARRRHEAILARKLAYRKARRAELSTKAKEYYAQHVEVVAKRQAAWYREHKVLVGAYIVRYRASHPDKVKVWSQRRIANLKALPATLTEEQWKAIKRAYSNRCAYCGKRPAKLTMDHVIPVVRGGGTVAENIVPACRGCNSSKKHYEPKALPALRLLL